MFRKNIAGQNIYFQLINATTGAGLTGATVAVRRCIDGTFAAGGGTVTEDTGGGSSPGFYKYAMAQADTNGNNIGLAFTATSAIPLEKTFITTAADPTDGVRLGLTALPNAAANAVGGLAILDANSLIDVDVKRINAIALAAQTLAQSTQTICYGTCSGGTTTTAVVSTLNNPNSLTASGQLIGRTIIFLGNTTTTTVQAQASNITANTTGATPTITFTAMTNAPANGDVFVIL